MRENLANDFGYNPAIARNVNADVRYLLSLVDKVHHGIWLLESWEFKSVRGILATAQASFLINYKGAYIGGYFADILAEDVLVIELKCVDRFANEHIARCLNYLRASGKSLCLLVNFQKPTVEWKRLAA